MVDPDVAARDTSVQPAVPPQRRSPRPPPKVYAPVVIPTAESMAQQEVINSCVTRSVMAGVMGAFTRRWR
jgi:hypothetical protein